MKILICPDKFKESLSAFEAASAIEAGIRKVTAGVECVLIPMADGGEGSAEVLVKSTSGYFETVVVHDPLMRKIQATIGFSGNSKTAFIEMAKASGLQLLKKTERNPIYASSYGTGELVEHALNKGCNEIIIAIGGSATVDGGTGMARALGIQFSDANGNHIVPTGERLSQIHHLDLSGRHPGLKNCRVLAASDVRNPLTGPNGAAFVFGPQKGASPSEVQLLDKNLHHLSLIIYRDLGLEISQIPGAGAAGGMGAGIMAFLGGKIENGFNLIADKVNLASAIAWSDLVITGEGKIDEQTALGKTPWGVAQMAASYNKVVIAFTGALMRELEVENDPYALIFPIVNKPMQVEEALQNAAMLLQNASERFFRTLMLGSRLNALFPIE